MLSALSLAANGVYHVAVELRALDGLLQRSLELRSSVYTLKFVNELLVAASEKAVAIVQR